VESIYVWESRPLRQVVIGMRHDRDDFYLIPSWIFWQVVHEHHFITDG